MIWGIHFCIVTFLLVFFKLIKKEKYYIKCIFIYSIFTFGQRWMTGEDFPGYLLYYITNFKVNEIGYKFLQDILTKNNIYFGNLIFIVYFLTLYNNFRFIKRCDRNQNLIIYLYCFTESYFAQMSQIRQWLAISFFINSLYYLYCEKGRIKQFINFILGMMFHKSIILMLPFSLFIVNLKKKHYFYLVLLMFMFPFINISIFLRKLTFVSYTHYLDSLYNQSLSWSHFLRYYYSLILTVIFIYCIKLKKINKFHLLILNGQILNLALYGLSFKFAPFMRMSYYFKIFEIVFLFTFLEKLIFFNKKMVKKLIILSTLIFYLFIALKDPYNITRYELRKLKFKENKSDESLREEIKNFYK